MNQYTSVDTYVGERITINDREAFRIPWIFHVYFYQGYQLSDSELVTLGRYLVGGGFIFADAHPLKEWSVASSHVNNLLGALETQGLRASFQRLPNTHPIYHCYFDFVMPPPGSEAWAVNFPQYTPERVNYLEGLKVDNHLVAILSRKGYYSCWCEWGPHAVRSGWRDLDPTRQFQFGVNLIVFALTQEGSITSRVLDSVRY